VTEASAAPIEQRLWGMAVAIRRLIPAAQIRLFRSWARGAARHDSDIDRLITAPDAWLASRDRFVLLADLWGAVAQSDLLVDLVLHSSSEAARRAELALGATRGAAGSDLLVANFELQLFILTLK